MDDFRVEAFDGKIHRRTLFDCGRSELSEFFRTLVTQYEKRRLGRTYVAVRVFEPTIALGYYTLAAGAVAFESLPHEVARKLPRHPAPAVLLARLAVDLSAQGKGLGTILVADAIWRGLEASKLLGAIAMEVLAVDEKAAGFYARFGFGPLLDDPRHMYLPMGMVEEQVAAIRKSLT